MRLRAIGIFLCEAILISVLVVFVCNTGVGANADANVSAEIDVDVVTEIATEPVTAEPVTVEPITVGLVTAEPDLEIVISNDSKEQGAKKQKAKPERIYANEPVEKSVEKPEVMEQLPQKLSEQTAEEFGEKTVEEHIDLEWVKEHLYLYYTDEEIRQTGQIVQAEDLIADSQTVWSAHVWVILGRVGASGFEQNDSIIGILSARNQFSTYTEDSLSKEVDPRIDWIVRDVFARKILEDMGAPEEDVGRTMPATHLFFKASGGIYNYFYRYCWGDQYDPFDAPHNPYDN